MRRFILARPPTFWLVACLLGMILIFGLAFSHRYSFAQYGNRPHATFASLSRLSVEGALLYVGGFAALFGLYWLGYRLGVRRLAMHAAAPSRRVWLLVFGGGMLLNAALLPLTPADATDLYDYVIRGRMLAFYGLNPMKDVPAQVEDDPFYRFVGWRNVPSAYGPAWEMIAGLAARLAGDDPAGNMLAFKIVAVLGYALAALGVGLALRHIAPRRAALGVYLFAWNPLVVFMAGGTAHNDSLVAASIALSVYAVARRAHVAAVLAALVGALVKFIPALLVPFIAVLALRQLAGARRLRFVALSGVLGAILLVAAYAPFWNGLDTLRAGRRAEMYTGSVAAVIRQYLAPVVDGRSGANWTDDTPHTNALIANATLAITALVFAWQALAVWRAPSPMTLIRAALIVLMIYLLVASLWFQNWYVVWVAPLAAMLDNTFLRRYVLFFSYLVTWEPPLYNFVTLRPRGWAPLPWRDLVPVAAYKGVAYGMAVVHWLMGWLRAGTRPAENIAIGRNLRAERERAGLSVADLADATGIPADAIARYEQGIPPLLHEHLITLRAQLDRKKAAG
ncbi:MAG: helix-turn-helix domain-containing protein [Anaerolineae bacterium]|nr:helix-turn-helix domain-containing protein [Anaerolineae bacterium]